MASTVQSLFGDMFKTPAQMVQEQQQKLMEQGRQSAGMMLAAAPKSGLAQAIAGHAAGIAQNIPATSEAMRRTSLGAMGLAAGATDNQQLQNLYQNAAMTPQEREAAYAQGVMKEAATGSPEGINKAIQLLESKGMTEQAAAMRARLKKAEKDAIVKANPVDPKNPAQSMMALGKALVDGGFDTEGTTYMTKGYELSPESLKGKDRVVELADGSYFDIVDKKLVKGTEGKQEYKAQSTIGKRLVDLGYAPNSPAWNARYEKMLKEEADQKADETAAMKGESEFFKEAGRQDAKAFRESRTAADNANSTLRTYNELDNLISSDAGMFTGFGANVRLDAARAADFLGLGGKDDAEKIANTETFIGTSAKAVADILSSGAFGAGTGISDNDREFVKTMAGANPSLDEQSIKRLIQIQRKVSVNTVQSYNKEVERINKQYNTGYQLKAYEGATATSADGKQKMIYKDGQWRMVNG